MTPAKFKSLQWMVNTTRLFTGASPGMLTVGSPFCLLIQLRAHSPAHGKSRALELPRPPHALTQTAALQLRWRGRGPPELSS